MLRGLMAFGTGIAKGGIDIVEDEEHAFQKQLLRRQKTADEVAAKWAENKQKQKLIADDMESFKIQYDVDDDLAWALANDEAFKRMKPEERPAHVKRMKPTGKFLPPKPPQVQTVLPQEQMPQGGLLRSLGVQPNVLPAVNAPVAEAQPARQVYSNTGKPKMGVREWTAMLGHMPPATDAGQQAVQMRVMQAFQNEEDVDPSDIALAWRGAGGHKVSDAHKIVTQLISSGHLEATNAETFFGQLTGGKVSGMDWGNLHTKPSAESKGKEDEVKMLMEKLDLPESQARKFVYGMYKISRDPYTDQITIVDMTTNSAVPIKQQISKDEIEATKATRERAAKQLESSPTTMELLRENATELKRNPGAIGPLAKTGETVGGFLINLARDAGMDPSQFSTTKELYDKIMENGVYRSRVQAMMASLASQFAGEGSRDVSVYERQLIDKVTGNTGTVHVPFEHVIHAMDTLHSIQLRRTVNAIRTLAPPDYPAILEDKNYQRTRVKFLVQRWGLHIDDAIDVVNMEKRKYTSNKAPE